MTPFLIILGLVLSNSFLIWKFASIYLKYKNINKNGIGASGEITDYQIVEGDNNNKTYFPVVKFKTLSGEIVEHKATFGLNYKQYINQEKSVLLKYLENNPKEYILEGVNTTKSIPIMITIFVVFLPVTIYLLFTNRPELLVELKKFLSL